MKAKNVYPTVKHETARRTNISFLCLLLCQKYYTDENPINCRKHTYNKYAWIVKGQVQHVCHIVYNSTHLKKIRVGAIHNNKLYTEIINDISREFTKDQWYNESLLNLKNSKVANTYVYWEGEFWPNG